MIKVIEWEESRDKYFFTTEERRYKTDRKTGKVNIIIKERGGWIDRKDHNKWGCTCVFASFYRFGQHWKDKYPLSTCKHIKVVLEHIKKNKGDESNGKEKKL